MVPTHRQSTSSHSCSLGTGLQPQSYVEGVTATTEHCRDSAVFSAPPPPKCRIHLLYHTAERALRPQFHSAGTALLYKFSRLRPKLQVDECPCFSSPSVILTENDPTSLHHPLQGHSWRSMCHALSQGQISKWYPEIPLARPESGRGVTLEDGVIQI